MWRRSGMPKRKRNHRWYGCWRWAAKGHDSNWGYLLIATPPWRRTQIPRAARGAAPDEDTVLDAEGKRQCVYGFAPQRMRRGHAGTLITGPSDEDNAAFSLFDEHFRGLPAEDARRKRWMKLIAYIADDLSIKKKTTTLARDHHRRWNANANNLLEAVNGGTPLGVPHPPYIHGRRVVFPAYWGALAG